MCPLRHGKTMIILSDYTLSCKEDSDIFLLRAEIPVPARSARLPLCIVISSSAS